MREMMWRNPGSAEGTHLLDSEIMVQLYDSADKKEGMGAFLEKRGTRFEGDFRTGTPGVVPWWEPIDINPARGRRRDGGLKL